tara:strand:+ start:505 stop:639 length:135 start_codon:yes stop_codon:yes gene_type:complete
MNRKKKIKNHPATGKVTLCGIIVKANDKIVLANTVKQIIIGELN